MYALLLLLHSWLRWLVIVCGVWAVLRAWGGVGSRRLWTPSDDAAGRWFTIGLDVQFLVGVVLYGFVSPITVPALGNLGGAMGNSVARFWAVEHPFMMVVAMVLAHVGRVRIRRA